MRRCLMRPKEAGGMGKRFVMVSGTGDFDGVIRGTAAECLKRYFEAMGYGFRIQEDEGEYWLYALNTAGGEENWEEYDQVEWAGSHEATLDEARRYHFMRYMIPECRYRDDLLILPEEKAGAFLMDYDELLGLITAREVREYCLDLDEEFETRLWFHENRGKRKAA